jgi:hypothetical protein
LILNHKYCHMKSKQNVTKQYVDNILICKSAGTRVIAMVEAIIGNINHLSKNAISDYSCEDRILGGLSFSLTRDQRCTGIIITWQCLAGWLRFDMVI